MFLWSLYDGPKNVVGKWELHPPFFLLLACLAVSFSIVLPIVVSWKTIRLWSPTNKFQALHPEIKRLRIDVDLTLLRASRRGKLVVEPKEKTALLALAYKLDKLKIRHPKLNDLRRWNMILPYFAAWAEVSDLESARSYQPGTEENLIL